MKKKSLLLVLLVAMFICISPVFAIDIHSCSVITNAKIDARVPQIVSTIITIIKIAVPILLVIFGMLDLIKGVIAQKEDEIKKGQQIFIKRLIAGALVFFVFTIVQFIISVIADAGENDNIMTCTKCFINGSCTYEKNVSGGCDNGYKLSSDKTFCVKK